MQRRVCPVQAAALQRPHKGFWGVLKSEIYYLQQFHTFEELEIAIDECNTLNGHGIEITVFIDTKKRRSSSSYMVRPHVD